MAQKNAWHTICFFLCTKKPLLTDWRINIAPLFFTRAKHKQNWQRLAHACFLSSCRVFVCLLAGRQWWRRGRYRGGLGQTAQFVWYTGSAPQGWIPHDERSVLWKKKGSSLLSLLLRDPVTLLTCSLIVERNSHWTEWLDIYYLFLSSEAASLNANQSWTANIKREKAIIRPRGTDKSGFLYFPIAYLIFWTPGSKRNDVSLILAKKKMTFEGWYIKNNYPNPDNNRSYRS